jgi:23S rRNA (adenine1618-N6)-methyltransferase
MSIKKKKKEKSPLHPRNKNRERYDLQSLVDALPLLENFIKLNKFGTYSIDFSNAKAVKLLNTAILKHYYGIKHWEFPDENLCPPIPGRADYIHYLADLLAEKNAKDIPVGEKITCLDVGVGASCIYPILGVTEYQWQFIASDINPKSIESSQQIVNANDFLKNKIDCRLQTNPEHIFQHILTTEEKVDAVMCNPPFHSSMEDAQKGTRRKVKNLSGQNQKSPKRNFAGVTNELVYEGGEYRFVQNMITESKKYSKHCFWFTAIISKKDNLKGLNKEIDKVGAYESKMVPMGTTNKTSRILAWTFLNVEEQVAWREARWL